MAYQQFPHDLVPGTVTVLTAADAAALLAPEFHGAMREQTRLLHLGHDNTCLGVSGAVGASPGFAVLPMRAFVRDALQRGTRAMILAHNHPSGSTRPSRADLIATRRLAELAQALEMRLLDHLIFAGPRCLSLRGLGLL